MKIIHKIFFNAPGQKKAIKQFQKLGIAMEVTEPAPFPSLYHFDMSEDNPLWPEIEKVLSSAGIHITESHTEFTKEEIMSAEWLEIYPHHRWGYPMPDLTWEWKERAFTPEQECQHCGIGLRQKAPINLKCEPKMGRNHFMGVFWLDEIFALNKVFDVLSQNGITGFEEYPAIHYKKKTPLETIKQLKVISELAPGVIPDNLARADVEKMEKMTADNIITHEPYPCGHVKYIGLGRGMYKFSRNIFAGMPDLVKTNEWFGGMRSAVQLILASAKFVKVYTENNWRGLSLNPIELI